MNLLSRLENMHVTYGDDIFRESADALALEQLLSDKLYRALVSSVSFTRLLESQNDKTTAIIIEALTFYETARMTEVSAQVERGF